MADIIISMKIRPIVILSIALIVFFCFGFSLRAQAAPPQQQFATNTPLPDGNIFYVLQAGDTSCFRVAALNNITVQQLRELNPGINEACSNLQIGQKLLIGIAGPAGPTVPAGSLPTVAAPTITPTPLAGTTEICVLLYNDMNGDALRQADEPAIAGGAVSVTETNGLYSKTLQTVVNSDPNAYPGVCFSDVPEGSYNIGVAIPDNYNATTNLTYTLDVKAGDRAEVSFGAQSRDAGAIQPGSARQGGGGASPILGFFGGFLLLGGLGLGYYALRLRTPQSKLKRSGLLKR